MKREYTLRELIMVGVIFFIIGIVIGKILLVCW